MGKGKKWSTEELKHLAEAWISISEDSGEAMVKGTNQESDEFWRRIYNVFISKLPNAPEGYANRALSAVRSQWKDKLSKYIRSFNKQLQKVQCSNPTGCSEQNIVNMAVAIQMGKTSVRSYLFKDYQAMDWPYYLAWLVLKDHRAFIPPPPPPADALIKEIEDEDDNVVNDDISAITNVTASGAANTPSVAGVLGASATKPKGSNSRGPGYGVKKTKQLAAQDEYRRKKAKCQEDMIEIQRQKQASFDTYVSNQAKAQAFKMAVMAYKVFKDHDIEEADKYKQKMEEIIEFETSADFNSVTDA